MPSTRVELLGKLQINIVAIVIAALFLVLVMSWVDTLRAFCAGVLKEEDTKRYTVAWKKLIVSFAMSFIFVFLTILIFTYVNSVK